MITNSALYDAFGRSRVSGTGQRADVEFIYDKQPLLFDDISANGGTVTHDTNARDLVLALNGADSNRVAGHRFHYWVPYTPGNGQLIEITGTFDSAGIGGGTCYTFLRSTVSGSTVYLHRQQQSEWLLDKHPAANWSNSHIFGIDFQSLKVGRIRYYMVRSGNAIVVDEMYNDNARATGYWQYPSLPPYWKIFNEDGNTIVEFGYGDELNGLGFQYVFDGIQSAATARAICMTVKSEGGFGIFDMPGFPFAASNGLTAITASSTLVPIISIQIATTFNSLPARGLSVPTSFSIQTDNPIYYKLIYRPTLTNSNFTAVNATYTHMNKDVSATAITGGIVIDEDYLAGGTRNQIAGEEGLLGRTIMSLGSGTSDILTLAAVRDGVSDASVKGVLKWKDIR